jgi:hypothetical protein
MLDDELVVDETVICVWDKSLNGGFYRLFEARRSTGFVHPLNVLRAFSKPG